MLVQLLVLALTLVVSAIAGYTASPKKHRAGQMWDSLVAAVIATAMVSLVLLQIELAQWRESISRVSAPNLLDRANDYVQAFVRERPHGDWTQEQEAGC